MRILAALSLLATGACFNPETSNPIQTGGAESSTGGGSSTTDASVGESSTTDASDTLGSSSSGVADSSTTAPSDDSGGSSSTGEPTPICGDGVLDRGTEQCDDGNDVAGDLCDAACQFEGITFSYSGATETFEVPAWVDELRVEAYGAQGGGGFCCDSTVQDDGGLGGYVEATLPTLAGLTLTVAIGGQGTSQGVGGFNGGGDGGQYAAGGGGASDLRIADGLESRILVAAGGGGGNCGCPDVGGGGAGGGLDGAPGISNLGFPAPGGASQSAGGYPGDGALAGDLGVGGTAETDTYHVAGGGGGYYGGGAAFAAGGGGGSSYYGGAIDASTTPGLRAGDGEIVITPLSSL